MFELWQLFHKNAITFDLTKIERKKNRQHEICCASNDEVKNFKIARK